jgi:hypothetical protein
MANPARTVISHSMPRTGLFAVFLAALGGCAPLMSFVAPVNEQPKPSPDCCQAVAQWSNRVHYEPDPTNGGVPTPGIVGRFYLFDSQVKDSLVGDGSVLVSLFDDSGPTASEKPIEIWFIDADTLQRLLRRDTIGWGYTLFLPWTTYKREINNVHLTVRYDPKQGSPLYTPSSPLTLEHPMTPTNPGTPDTASIGPTPRLGPAVQR